MAFVDTAYAPQPIGRGLVIEVAGQRMARIGGHCQHTALGQQLGRPPQHEPQRHDTVLAAHRENKTGRFGHSQPRLRDPDHRLRAQPPHMVPTGLPPKLPFAVIRKSARKRSRQRSA